MKKKKTPKKTAKPKTRKTASKSRGHADRELREQVVYLLKGGGAHVHFMDALDDFPPAKYGTFANSLPHTGWELLEHLRLAQRDILEFSRNPKHVSPPWPAGYWPPTPEPPDDAAWDNSVQAFRSDLDEMRRLVEAPETDLSAPIPHGDGQTILREALLVADHNAYHLGQFVLVRKLLGAWEQA